MQRFIYICMCGSHKKSLFFYSARRQGFYFACVQLTIGGGRCHVTKHMRGTTVQKQKQISGKRGKYSSGLIPSSFQFGLCK